MKYLLSFALFGGLLIIIGDSLPKDASADPKTPSKVLKIGLPKAMFRDVADANINGMLKPFQQLIKDQTGFNGQAVVVSDSPVMAKQLDEGEIHVGVFFGQDFAWVSQNHKTIQPVVVAVPRTRKQEGVVVVRSDSESKSIRDLANKTIDIPSGTREFARVFMEGECSKAMPPITFQKINKSASIEDALNSLVKGDVDAVLAHGEAVAIYAELNPGRGKKLRVVGKSDPFPFSVVAMKNDSLATNMHTTLSKGLLQTHQTTSGRNMLLMFGLSRFEAVPADYGTQVQTFIKAYPQRIIPK
jgi:ABC-type phosphate/phosphonate transport system substrate-binding protein